MTLRLAIAAVCASATVSSVGAQPAPAPAAAPGFEARIPDKLELVAGTPGSLGIAIAVDRGLTISRDAGLAIDLAPDAAIAIKRHRLGRADAVDPEADDPRFAVPVRAEVAGDYAIAVHARFWLCNAKTCRPIDVKKTVTVAVSGGSGGSGGSGSGAGSGSGSG